jgi:hypothetical protein
MLTPPTKEEAVMAIVVRFSPPNVTPDQYDQASAKADEMMGGKLPDGCQLHVAFTGSDGSFYVSEVWDSREQWEAFGEKLMPMLADLGIDPGEPQVCEVHNLQTR